MQNQPLDLKAIWKKYEDEFSEFDNVQNKRSACHDIHAFLLLNDLVPQKYNILSGAEHDRIFLAVSPEELAEVATEEQVLELIRCGVQCDSSADSLTMFV